VLSKKKQRRTTLLHLQSAGLALETSSAATLQHQFWAWQLFKNPGQYFNLA
jgi:hypothetical protein